MIPVSGSRLSVQMALARAWHTIRWTAAAQTLTLSRTCRTAPRLAYGGGLIWLYDSALGRLLALKPDGTESLRLELDEPVYSLAPIENGTMAQSWETLLRCTANGVADAGACSGSIWSLDDGGWLETDADGLWHSTEAGARPWPSGPSAAFRCRTSQRSHSSAGSMPS